MDGRHLKRKLLEAGTTQKDLATFLGITAQSLSSVLSAKDVKSGTIERIAKALNLPVSFFYDEIGNNAFANGDSSVAVSGNNNSHVVAGGEAIFSQERIKYMEELLAEKERLIKVYEKMVEEKK